MRKTTSAKKVRDGISELRTFVVDETTTVTSLWEKYLGSNQYSSEWFEGLEKFWILIQQLERDIQKSTLDEEVKKDFLKHVKLVSGAGQSPQMQTAWRQTKETFFKEDALVKLGYIHSSLRLEIEHAEIAKEDAKELIELAEEILATLNDATVPDDLALHIRKSLAQIIFALKHIAIFGPAGFEAAVETFIGTTMLHSNEVYSADKKIPGFLPKIRKFAGRALGMAKWTNDTADTIENSAELIRQIADAAGEVIS